jgi:hypothetical protein
MHFSLSKPTELLGYDLIESLAAESNTNSVARILIEKAVGCTVSLLHGGP